MDIYKPVLERIVDTQYEDMLRTVLAHGIVKETQQEVPAITLPYSYRLLYDVANGAPISQVRKMAFLPKALAELFKFIGGTRTLEGLEEAGCNWWSAWATPEKCAKRGLATGDLGPGSYGPAYHDFPMPDGGTFNQFENVVAQIKERPHLRTHVVTSWIPFYNFRNSGNIQKVVVSPCHGTVIKWTVFDGKLNQQMVQRSGDLLPGVPSNMAQYFALLLAMAQVTGLRPWMYEHVILDPHIYVDQVEKARELLVRKPKPLATMRIVDPSIMDIFAFRKEHFAIEWNDPHPAVTDIPVAT